MKAYNFKICFFPLLLLLLSTPCHAFPCKVVRVSDGDTITCLKAGNIQAKIRLYGIDAPEKKQAFGQQARKALAKMVAGKTVEIEDTGKDRYGRIVGIIKNEGGNINSRMVKEGFAWVYPAFCRRPECAQWRSQETEAKAARRGLWRDKQAVPPWKWRKKGKK